MAEYDPFSSVEITALEEPKEIKPLSMSDPFGGVEITSAGKTDVPFKFPEESWTAVALDTIPYGKYALPEEQDKLNRMSDDERTSALAWAGVGAALFFLGGPLLKGVSRGASSAVRLGGRALSSVVPDSGMALASRLAKTAELPIEDVMAGISPVTKQYNLKPFSYETAVRNSLKGNGFKQEEVEAIVKAQVTKDPRAYADAVVERLSRNKPMSQAWQDSILPRTDVPYGGYGMTDDWSKSLSYEALQGRHLKKQYEKILEEGVLNTRKFPKEYAQNIYEKQMLARNPDLGPNVAKLENITERDFADFVYDMVGHRREYRSGLSTTSGRLWPASLTPTRIIYGLNEESWKARSQFYEPLRTAYEESKTYAFDWAHTWANMLHQRGLAKIKFDNYGGVALDSIKFTKAEADEAYKVLKGLDAITAKYSGANAKNTAALNGEVINLMSGIDPMSNTQKLIDTWRDFSDTLYGDYMTRKLPQLLNQGGNLSIFGQNGVDADESEQLQVVRVGYPPADNRNEDCKQ